MKKHMSARHINTKTGPNTGTFTVEEEGDFYEVKLTFTSKNSVPYLDRTGCAEGTFEGRLTFTFQNFDQTSYPGDVTTNGEDFAPPSLGGKVARIEEFESKDGQEVYLGIHEVEYSEDKATAWEEDEKAYVSETYKYVKTGPNTGTFTVEEEVTL